jgi:FO synthase
MKGFTLRARLPIYPEFINNYDKYGNFVPNCLKKFIEDLIDNSGLVKEEYVK